MIEVIKSVKSGKKKGCGERNEGFDRFKVGVRFLNPGETLSRSHFFMIDHGGDFS